MSATLSPNAPAVLRDYYRILEGGSGAYQNGAQLRGLLSPHLDFTGPLAGHRPDSTDAFLHGVAGFIATVQNIDIVRDVHDNNGSAVLYEATMAGGTMTFAEFFTFAEGRIATLQLHYNGQEYIDKGGH